jgi:elongation factor G
MAQKNNTGDSVDLVSRRNIGIIAHIDAGKTTTTERLLIFTNRENKSKPGEVHEGKATTDFMVQERERGITIQSATVQFEWEVDKEKVPHLPQTQEGDKENYVVNIIDTPGHIDFTIEVLRSLKVLDGVVVVLAGRNGIEAQTMTVWNQANTYKVPRIVFINKMDSVGADLNVALKSFSKLNLRNSSPIVVNIPVGVEENFSGVIDLIDMSYIHWSDKTGKTFEKLPIPDHMKDEAKKWREELVEKAVVEDDVIMEKYLDTGDICKEDLLRCIRKGTLSLRLFPVLCGSAFKNKGVQPLLDAVAIYLPSPLDRHTVKAFDIQNNQVDVLPTDNKTVALVFKVVTDPFMGTICFTRIYSGSIKAGDTLYISGTKKKIRVGQLFRVYADKKEHISEGFAGDIIGLGGQGDLTTGTTLSSDFLILEKMDIPEAVVSLSITPVTKSDSEKLSEALRKLLHEDPSLRSSIDQKTKGIILSGMGELHLEIIVDRLLREHGVAVTVGKPQVAYKETITRESEITHVHKKQTGGAGQFAGVTLSVAPINEEIKGGKDDNIKFLNEIVSGDIPKEYIPSVEVGVLRAAQKGVIYNSPLVNFTCRLITGSYHDVDSSTLAFEIAGHDAAVEALKKARPILLEPIMTFDLDIPTEYVRAVTGDINRRRGCVLETEHTEDFTHIVSEAPLAEMFGFAKDFRSLTQGRGIQSPLTLKEYRPVPQLALNQLIKEKV